jgi:hypothetical protein
MSDSAPAINLEKLFDCYQKGFERGEEAEPLRGTPEFRGAFQYFEIDFPALSLVDKCARNPYRSVFASGFVDGLEKTRRYFKFGAKA